MLPSTGSLAALALALALALAACAPAAPRPAAPPAPREAPAPTAASSAHPPAVQQMVEEARREGQLQLIWSSTTIGGAAAVQRWAESFNRYYGLNLDVVFTPGPAMAETVTKVIQEHQSGRRASTDVVIGTETHVATALEHDVFEPVDWPSWAPNIQRPDLFAPNQVAVQITSIVPNIAYNSDRVSGDRVPRTLEDLLRPEYKGRVASTPYAGLFDALATRELWGEPRTVEYVTRLADQIGGLIRAGEHERLLSGEFDILAINGTDYQIRQWQARGAPLAYVIPTDAPLLNYRYMGVPRNAAHPNAGKLWINYLLSREGQDILYEIAYTDHHRLPGAKTADGIQALEAQGIKFVDVDPAFLLRNDPKELDRLSADMQRILQKK